jgi:hypothetical protein
MRIRCSTSYWLVLLFFCLTSLTNCGTVKSVVPGMGGDSTSEAKAGERLHFKITPEEALAILVELAPQNGWEVISTGDQYDLQGPRGKYFRLETTRFIGGRSSMSGVFFSEPAGTYVIVGKKDSGLPQDLVAPLIAAIEGRGETAAAP